MGKPALNSRVAREAVTCMLSTQELAEVLGVSVDTIYDWNSKGSGPRRFRVGRHVRFRLTDVDEWLERHAADGGGGA
jgi:excisionase family DNA binding protein